MNNVSAFEEREQAFLLPAQPPCHLHLRMPRVGGQSDGPNPIQPVYRLASRPDRKRAWLEGLESRFLAIVVFGICMVWSSAKADTIVLKNGQKMSGRIIAESETQCYLKLDSGATQKVEKADIEAIEKVAPAKPKTPGGGTMPTVATRSTRGTMDIVARIKQRDIAFQAGDIGAMLQTPAARGHELDECQKYLASKLGPTFSLRGRAGTMVPMALGTVVMVDDFTPDEKEKLAAGAGSAVRRAVGPRGDSSSFLYVRAVTCRGKTGLLIKIDDIGVIRQYALAGMGRYAAAGTDLGTQIDQCQKDLAARLGPSFTLSGKAALIDLSDKEGKIEIIIDSFTSDEVAKLAATEAVVAARQAEARGAGDAGLAVRAVTRDAKTEFITMVRNIGLLQAYAAVGTALKTQLDQCQKDLAAKLGAAFSLNDKAALLKTSDKDGKMEVVIEDYDTQAVTHDGKTVITPVE